MIRTGQKTDISALMKIEQELFSSPWPQSEFLYELNENPFSTVYIYEEDDVIAGFADLWITYEQAQIANIGVAKKYQGLGYGNALLRYCVNQGIKNECENLTLEVRVSNDRAIQVYEKNGFITVNKRKKYYEDGEDAYLMVKPLGGLEYDNDTGA
ncbi:MAG: ribosomal protein S18-alanine N-acetyltransferase [Erysipelotrichaceae bacterium]|jgi:ribosomal-protein-alanine N-acetyltransferase|nr:ribosomal protein S18-alanine N-acetyltransferase [Erysipelotrichaceae bacterium]